MPAWGTRAPCEALIASTVVATQHLLRHCIYTRVHWRMSTHPGVHHAHANTQGDTHQQPLTCGGSWQQFEQERARLRREYDGGVCACLDSLQDECMRWHACVRGELPTTVSCPPTYSNIAMPLNALFCRAPQTCISIGPLTKCYGLKSRYVCLPLRIGKLPMRSFTWPLSGCS